MNTNSKIIYIADPAGALCVCLLNEVPGFGYQVPADAIDLGRELAAPAEGFVWTLVEGEPVLRADHRGEVYSTESGESRPHTILGDLPEGLTTLKWPGHHYVWTGNGWTLDEVAQLEAVLGNERAWRNGAIASTDYLVMPDYPINAEQRSDLYAYRQALRNWPSVDQFPDPQARPQPPAWLSEQLL